MDRLAPLFLGLVLLGACATAPRTYDVAGPYGNDAALFVDELSPYGEWFWSDAYGWMWQPYNVPRGWRPYSQGTWAYTSLGWTWQSAWDWGWAPFHYGRWTTVGGRGWAWVPGRQWAPAWVAWRRGPGFVGWAPLPPTALWTARRGLVFTSGLGLGPGAWVFVQPRSLFAGNVAGFALPFGRYPTYLRTTRPIVRYGAGPQGVIHRGVERQAVERELGRPLPRAQLVERDRPPRPSREGIPPTAQRAEVFRPQQLRPSPRADRVVPPRQVQRAPRDPGGRPFIREDARAPQREAFRDPGRARPPRPSAPPRQAPPPRPPGGTPRPARPSST
jgi:hypothetical protein